MTSRLRIGALFFVLVLLVGALPTPAAAATGSVSLTIHNVGASSAYTGSLECRLYDSSGSSLGSLTTTSGNCSWSSVSSGSYTFVWKPYSTGALADEYWGSKIFSSAPYSGTFTRTAPYGNSAISPGSTSQSVGDTTSQSLTVKNDRPNAASIKMLCVWDVDGDSSWDEQASTGYVSIPSGGANTFTCNHLIGSGMAGKTYKFGYEVITDLTSTGGGEWVTDSYWTTATLTVASAATSPSAPQSLSVAPGNGQNGLGWNTPSSDGGSAIIGYRVFRGTEIGSESLVTTGGCANPGVALMCTDTGLTNGQTYYYRVRAVNDVGQGPQGNEASAAPAAAVTFPDAPTGLTGTAVSSARIDLSWNAPSDDGGSVITGYRIYRATQPNWEVPPLTTTGDASTSYVDTSGLAADTTYYYRITAVNSAGDSLSSNEASAATPDPNAAPATPSKNLPPHTPSSPTPAHGTSGVTLDTLLSWTGGDPDVGDDVTYDLFLGIQGTAMSVRCSGTYSTTCPNSNLGDLQAATTYAWRVDARDNHGEVTSGIPWSFTTTPPTTTTTTPPATGTDDDPEQLADLVVNDISFSPNPPIVDQSVEVTCIYSNRANAASTDSAFGVQVSIDGGTPKTSTSQALLPGQTGSHTFTFTDSYNAGSHSVVCEVNKDRAVAESNYYNSGAPVPIDWVADLVAVEPEPTDPELPAWNWSDDPNRPTLGPAPPTEPPGPNDQPYPLVEVDAASLATAPGSAVVIVPIHFPGPGVLPSRPRENYYDWKVAFDGGHGTLIQRVIMLDDENHVLEDLGVAVLTGGACEAISALHHGVGVGCDVVALGSDLATGELEKAREESPGRIVQLERTYEGGEDTRFMVWMTRDPVITRPWSLSVRTISCDHKWLGYLGDGEAECYKPSTPEITLPAASFKPLAVISEDDATSPRLEVRNLGVGKQTYALVSLDAPEGTPTFGINHIRARTLASARLTDVYQLSGQETNYWADLAPWVRGGGGVVCIALDASGVGLPAGMVCSVVALGLATATDMASVNEDNARRQELRAGDLLGPAAFDPASPPVFLLAATPGASETVLEVEVEYFRARPDLVLEPPCLKTLVVGIGPQGIREISGPPDMCSWSGADQHLIDMISEGSMAAQVSAYSLQAAGEGEIVALNSLPYQSTVQVNPNLDPSRLVFSVESAAPEAKTVAVYVQRGTLGISGLNDLRVLYDGIEISPASSYADALSSGEMQPETRFWALGAEGGFQVVVPVAALSTHTVEVVRVESLDEAFVTPLGIVAMAVVALGGAGTFVYARRDPIGFYYLKEGLRERLRKAVRIGLTGIEAAANRLAIWKSETVLPWMAFDEKMRRMDRNIERHRKRIQELEARFRREW